MNRKLKKYLYTQILPVYAEFDKGHDINHILAVSKRSVKYYYKIDNKSINKNMVYTIAFYHDIGMRINRKNHAYHSGQILINDKNLLNWFSLDQIHIMQEACEDHSTSSKILPRSIYGKIISDADKDVDINLGILRAWEFAAKNFPDFTQDMIIKNIHEEIIRRFGEKDIGGENLVKYYLNVKKNNNFIKKMKYYAYNFDDFEKKVKKLKKIKY